MVKNYILDTNVLIHDPECIFNFQDNNVIIPFPVIEEVDKLKTRNDKVAKSARDINRLLDNFRENGNLHEGIKLKNKGTLKIETLDKNIDVPKYFGQSKDDHILFYAKHINDNDNDIETIVVSKDLNVRVKASAIGLKAEDYLTDKIDIKVLPDGYFEIEKNENLDEKEYIEKSEVQDLLSNSEINSNTYLKYGDSYYIFNEDEKFEKINLSYDNEFYSISPRNIEQLFAFNALFNENIKFVTLVGIAGTGKTLVSLAGGLTQVIELKKYDKLMISKPVIPMGKDIGYLPGSIEEKMRPWLKPIYDNLEFLFTGKGKKPENYLEKNEFLEIEVLSYIRGRSIPDQFIIIDEAQNLTPAEVKTILTRVGENTKIVLTGDPYQIDNPYLDSSSNGLVYAASKFKNSSMAAHITMKKGERSELATLAAEIL
ncbi:MAG: PhoH family protein [Thermotogota bacterium]